MLKTMMIAAFAVVGMSAFAQDKSWNHRDRDGIDEAGKSDFSMSRFVWRQDENLQGPDRYTFETMLNRMPANEENALIKGIFRAHRQAVMVREQMIASRYPENEIELSANGNTTLASVEEGNRPMRMVMQAPMPRDIDYRTALDILTSSLNATEANWVGDFWVGATDTQRDVVVRLLKCSAAKADEPIYASLYTHRTYDWIVTPTK